MLMWNTLIEQTKRTLAGYTSSDISYYEPSRGVTSDFEFPNCTQAIVKLHTGEHLSPGLRGSLEQEAQLFEDCMRKWKPHLGDAQGHGSLYRKELSIGACCIGAKIALSTLRKHSASALFPLSFSISLSSFSAVC